MGCSKCKNKKTTSNQNEKLNENDNSLVKSFLVILTKSLLFMVTSVILTIIVIPFSIYLLFKAIFLNSTIDTSLMMEGVKKMISKDPIITEKNSSQ